MPLEISEIGVRLAVGESAASSEQKAGGSGSSCGDSSGVSPAQMEEIVQACVQDVLRALRMLENR